MEDTGAISDFDIDGLFGVINADDGRFCCSICEGRRPHFAHSSGSERGGGGGIRGGGG